MSHALVGILKHVNIGVHVKCVRVCPLDDESACLQLNMVSGCYLLDVALRDVETFDDASGTAGMWYQRT